MKVTIHPVSETIELTDEQIARLCEIGRRTNYYWTQGRGGELLDELSDKGLVYAGCGGGSDEQYRLTNKGLLVFNKLPHSIINKKVDYEKIH